MRVTIGLCQLLSQATAPLRPPAFSCIDAINARQDQQLQHTNRGVKNHHRRRASIVATKSGGELEAAKTRATHTSYLTLTKRDEKATLTSR